MSAAVPSPASVGPLTEAFVRANYNVGGLMVALGGEIDTVPSLVPIQSRTFGHSDQAVLARIFLLGVPVQTERAAEALQPASVADLVDAGWLVKRDGHVHSPLRITPFQGLLLVHDPLVQGPMEPDVVLGLSSAARTLASLTPRRPVSAALDVGTGCGMHALLAAGHADRVVATDVNKRALALTELGAALSGVGNVECREGSFFEPVAGEQFDLIVSNPPFVISPEEGLVYRDGTLGRDEVSRVAVQGAAAHLADGGIAQLLINWVVGTFEPWAQPLTGWIDGAHCDALLLHHLTEEPLEYAAKWNVHLRTDADEHGRVLDEWTSHFEREDIHTLATGAVTLRRTIHPALFSRLEMATGPTGDAGEHVLRLLAAARWLDTVDDAEVMATPVRLVDDHRLISERPHEDGQYGDDKVSIVLEHCAGLNGTLDGVAAAVLVGLEGGDTPADAVQGLSPLVADSGVADVEHLVASTVRQLISRGLVEPAAGF